MLNPISSFCSASCICQHYPFSLLIRDLIVALHSLVNATLWLHSQTFSESSEVRQQFLPYQAVGSVLLNMPSLRFRHDLGSFLFGLPKKAYVKIFLKT